MSLRWCCLRSCSCRVNTSSTVGWVELLLTGEQSKTYHRLKKSNMEEDGTFEFFLKRVHCWTTSLEKFWAVSNVLIPWRNVIRCGSHIKNKSWLRNWVSQLLWRWSTQTRPDDIDVVIPANDDAIRAVKLITTKWLTLCYRRTSKVKTVLLVKLNWRLLKVKLI